MSEVNDKARLAKEASLVLGRLSSDKKNAALSVMADALIAEKASIIEANAEDLERGRQNGTAVPMLDRLSLTDERIEGIASGLRQIIDLPDPIGDVLEVIKRPNGLRIEKERVPLGLIGIIYEARPNVTVDAVGLSLKTGNAVLLRGGSSALSSNKQIIKVLKQALVKTDLPSDAIQLIEDANRSSVDEMLKCNKYLDVIIPRGGASLIQSVVQNSTVPVIETGAGICHTYIDAAADPEMALQIALNAKVQRPSVCNAMETLLIHSDYGNNSIIELAERFKNASVELRGCESFVKMVPWAVAATEEDYATEYNDYILNVRIVDHMEEAIHHIRKYGTMHSECIVTSDPDAAARFMQEVDAAAVYHNASTRFTDGFEFGFGAEIGISTQKLHARGPMGLPALTSTKYRIYGSGQIKH
ncbi:glutamate-5-semialdehyde dehydrogenase [Paenibacillus provencensis]|uniref:Gamma-glutamyl phosphate reductase n=1 Tax=Paenibacillus provencensis TaxID=441151 RepID=A0ABW3PTM0_9BACL|nr:glutamate-5-semialdehyde dehydrogenase [Paenibacillus sp. MER 78]MCM3126610.1 glutamate-5-semialdehyde dehydrogenase [Paenibacillus sp. MER 78]